MKITTILTGVAVSDIDAAIDYYERLFGRPVDDRPMPILAEFHLSEGVVQLITAPDRAGQSLLALTVDDLNAALGELAERGITPAADTEAGTKEDYAVLNDPEGTMITLVQVRVT